MSSDDTTRVLEVTVNGGTISVSGATTFVVADHHLLALDKAGNAVAAFTPSAWIRAAWNDTASAPVSRRTS